jgi:hypothetical protein
MFYVWNMFRFPYKQAGKKQQDNLFKEHGWIETWEFELLNLFQTWVNKILRYTKKTQSSNTLGGRKKANNIIARKALLGRDSHLKYASNGLTEI